MKLVELLKEQDTSSFGKKTIALSLAGIMNTILHIILQMIIARLYSKGEMAIYSQTLLVYNSVFSVLQLGVPSGMYYYLVRNRDRTRAIMKEGVLIVLIASTIFSVGLLLGGNVFLAKHFANPALKQSLLWVIPYTLICVPETVVMTALVYMDRIKFNAWYTFIKSLISISVMIVVALLCAQGQILFASRTLVYCMWGIISFYIIYKYVVPRNSNRIIIASMRKLLVISLPLGMASLAGTLSTNLDGWIVSWFSSPEEYAVFQMGAYEIPFVSVITGSIMTVVTVELNNSIKDGNYSKAVNIFCKVAEKTAFILMPVMVFFFFAGKNFICLLYSSQYSGATLFFDIYLLYLPARIVSYGPFMTALGRSKFLLRREVMSLMLNAFLSVILVKKIGVIGASISTIAVTYVYSVPANLFMISKDCGQKWYRILPFSAILKDIVCSLPGGVTAYLINCFLPLGDNYLWRFVIMFLAFGVVTFGVYLFAARDSMDEMLKFIKGRFKKSV